MKHLLLVSVLLFGCAHRAPLTVAEPSKEVSAPAPNPFADILNLLGTTTPKKKTAPCLANNCSFAIKDEIDDDMAVDFKDWIESAATNKVINVNISMETPGGSVDAGYEIIHALEAAEKGGITSTCTVDHEAASMGFNILQSCTVRQITKRSTLMTHQIKASVKARMAQQDFQNAANMLAVDNRAAAEQCVRRMKIGVDEFLSHTAGGKEWYMGWEEAVRVGAVDAVVNP